MLNLYIHISSARGLFPSVALTHSASSANCLLDGHEVKQNFTEGRRLLVQANAQELASVLRSSAMWRSQHFYARLMGLVSYPLLSDFKCNVPMPELHWQIGS
ncbi:hypothetical protein PS1_038279 [Malus domestica]